MDSGVLLLVFIHIFAFQSGKLRDFISSKVFQKCNVYCVLIFVNSLFVNGKQLHISWTFVVLLHQNKLWRHIWNNYPGSTVLLQVRRSFDTIISKRFYGHLQLLFGVFCCFCLFSQCCSWQKTTGIYWNCIVNYDCF